MRSAYHEQLEALEQMLLEQGRVAAQALAMALDALHRQDSSLATETIALDDRLDDLHLEIQRTVEELLARQSPVAGDLRLVLAISHMSRHIERIGDQCATIAKLVRLTAGLPADPPMVMVLEEMAARALQMTRAALDCLSRRDRSGAAELDTLDELIDDLNRGITRRAIDLDAKPELREWAIHMVLVARAIERIGDNAVAIAKQAAYLVTGSREGDDVAADAPRADSAPADPL